MCDIVTLLNLNPVHASGLESLQTGSAECVMRGISLSPACLQAGSSLIHIVTALCRYVVTCWAWWLCGVWAHLSGSVCMMISAGSMHNNMPSNMRNDMRNNMRNLRMVCVCVTFPGLHTSLVCRV